MFQKAIKRWQYTAKHASVKKTFSHLYGPQTFQLEADEVALILVGRDVAHFLEHNIRTHKKLGVSRIVYVDNGSTDDSIEIAKSFDNAIVARTNADFSKHEPSIRYFANTLYTRGGWRLAIDPDEILDLPGRGDFNLSDVIKYMTKRRHTGLVAQMLEMVPNQSIDEISKNSFARNVEIFNRFDLRNITSTPYHKGETRWKWYLDENEISNPKINILHGGIRKTLFGENCCLTKHALFKIGYGVIPMQHPHVTTGLRCTDFSALLKHYKFSGGVSQREKKLIRDGRIAHNEANLRMQRLENHPSINLGSYAEKESPSTEFLEELGFLEFSQDAADFFKIQSKKR